MAEVLRREWSIQGDEIADLLANSASGPRHRMLRSILSGPIDVDKMDYLMRDSLHAGVPYGRNFDQARLISSLCLNERGDGLALTEKGRTAAEMMVFARYVMFSEVYWHHAVRAATAMLQRAFFLLQDRLDVDRLFRLTELPFIDQLRQAADPRILGTVCCTDCSAPNGNSTSAGCNTACSNSRKSIASWPVSPIPG